MPIADSTSLKARPVVQIPRVWREEDLLERLHRRYNAENLGAPRYTVIEKPPVLREGASYGTREIDALVLDSYTAPAKAGAPRHLPVHLFEIKVSRSDLLAELRDASKAGAWERFGHYFWLVVPSRDIIEGIDLPAHWGVLFPETGGSLRARPAAKYTEAAPIPMDALPTLFRRREATVARQAARSEATAKREAGWRWTVTARAQIDPDGAPTPAAALATRPEDLTRPEAVAAIRRQMVSGTVVDLVLVHGPQVYVGDSLAGIAPEETDSSHPVLEKVLPSHLRSVLNRLALSLRHPGDVHDLDHEAWAEAARAAADELREQVLADLPLEATGCVGASEDPQLRWMTDLVLPLAASRHLLAEPRRKAPEWFTGALYERWVGAFDADCRHALTPENETTLPASSAELLRYYSSPVTEEPGARMVRHPATATARAVVIAPHRGSGPSRRPVPATIIHTDREDLVGPWAL